MNEAVFIADLHLHPHAERTLAYFRHWLDWAATHTRSVYILGDFFHAWAGDDTLDAWSLDIAEQLRGLVRQGVRVYFMPGNRDFLLGPLFAARAGVCFLSEPTVLQWAEQRVLLAHGDGYCLQDGAHQWFRCITRHAYFKRVFLALPRRVRQMLVQRVRQRSQNRTRTVSTATIGLATLARVANQYQVDVIIHGHTHQPQLTTHVLNGRPLQYSVLSDWDASPWLLCYHKGRGFYGIQTAYEG